MKIIRVFPRRTNATPDDDLVRIAESPGLFDECDEVHVSVTWTWDLPLAERIVKAWSHVAPVKLGGPATGEPGGEFVAGRYLKHGYTITSRGCPNRCWFCSVWKREGDVVRELPIVNGWNVLDDNLLACSPAHIKDVFSMLARQKRRPEFTGGLEAKRLQQWHVEELRKLKPKQLFFAYDTQDDLEPLFEAGKMLRDAGINITKNGTLSHRARCYVLCGYPKDTFAGATARMHESLDAGFLPMAMLYRDNKGLRDIKWMRWAKQWARPALIGKYLQERRCA